VHTLDEFLLDTLEGMIGSGRVFDRLLQLEQVPEGYRAMNERNAIEI
jgi:hypothetical protein